MMFFGCNISSVNSLNTVPKCFSMNNEECKVRPEIININSDKPSFYPYSNKISKCSGSCNNINDSYAKLCIHDVSKNINRKVFNLISRTNETRYIKWHQTCKCKCRLDASACNNKQRWNNDKCRSEWKELTNKGICDEGFIWNPSNCECDKSYDVGEYLNYANCKCRKRLIDKLVEECSQIIDEKELHSNETLNKNILNSCECTHYLLCYLLCF